MHEQYDSSKQESYGCHDVFPCEINHVEHKERIELEIPHLKLMSIANTYEHWTSRKKRVDKEHELVNLFIRPHIRELRFPLRITFIRVSPRKLDDEDNFRMSLKNIKDKVAHIFFPDTRMGMADGLDCFEWCYEQIKGKVREHRVLIRFEEI